MAENQGRSNRVELKYLLLLGAIQAVTQSTVDAPMDRVKILLQVQHVNQYIPKEKRFQGIGDCIVRVYREQGILSYWRGYLPDVICHSVLPLLNFLFNEQLKKYTIPYDPSSHLGQLLLGSLASGGIAGGLSSVVVYPFIFARTRLAADCGISRYKREFYGWTDCMQQTIQTNGIRGLYKGLGVHLLGMVTYKAMYFGFFETGKVLLYGDNAQASIPQIWLLAQATSITAGAIAYPLDTIRKRMMMQTGRKEILYKNGRDCFKKMLRKEGFTSFYRGYIVNLVSNVGAAMALSIYDELKQLKDI